MLYTNKEPLFSARLGITKEVIGYVFSDMKFFRLMTGRQFYEHAERNHGMYYHDFSADPGYGVVPSEDVQEKSIVRCTPTFLCDMMQDDVFFPNILPDSAYFNNPPINFYGLMLRKVVLGTTETVDGDLDKLIMHEFDCVELLVGTEKFVCFTEDLKAC